MDLQGIGAVAAAGVTLATIPVLLITGRWQTRAALQGAQEAGRAGFAQAQATYNSALDAANAQASAAHAQWRRGIQRDAYASFLLAAQRIAEAGDQLMVETTDEAATVRTEELDRARSALRAAAQIVTLEGPDSVDGAAHTILACSLSLANMHESDAAMNRLQQRLFTMSELSDGSMGNLMRDQARRLLTAGAQLQTAIAENPHPNPNINDYRHTPDIMPTAVADAAAEAHAALSAFSDETFSAAERNTLSDMQFRGPFMAQTRYTRRGRELEEAHVAFLRAARAELGATSSHA
ncbi:hypothetical protein AB0A05_07235 [Streptomyces sp. NPDC046374]|uniref:hypothetical protein n=1 Tax=Streptomyces sp. NPDC046374 TaxID=3154917 RepID=UPI0033F62EAF